MKGREMTATGSKLSLRTVHQDTKRFASHETIAQVIEGADQNPNKIRVRVYRPYWGVRGATKGHLHWLHRISEKIWLGHIGMRYNGDGTTNLPQVHEVTRELSDA